MKIRHWLSLLFFISWNASIAFAGDGRVLVAADLQINESGATQLVIRVEIPFGYMLYADHFQVDVPVQTRIIPLSMPVPLNKKDAASGEQKQFYDKSFSAVYLLENRTNRILDLKVRYQGCDQSVCFLPAEDEFHLDVAVLQRQLKDQPVKTAVNQTQGTFLPEDIRSKYAVATVQTGYIPARGFVSFLDSSLKGTMQPGIIQQKWRAGRIWISVLLMVMGGLALNLTPCVLPLIPVNLAIIGAGIRATSVRRGFLLGTLYASGIVLAYGGLGLLTVLTGAQFGAINASPWFNMGVALLFMILGLALLDVLVIDFSRFQGRFNMKGRGLFFVIILGAVSALLAGACVAPVIIAVLLLSSDLYLKGDVVGLALPFLLGIGMALPWPFAGAGLSFLPKPGKWMLHVKHIFAAIIILTAIYYGTTGIKVFYQRYKMPEGNTSPLRSGGDWLLFPDGITNLVTDKPILLYFWATWCKNCQAMNAATFSDARVRKKMEEFVCVKFQAENPHDPATAKILREFGVIGLPTFVVLKPEH